MLHGAPNGARALSALQIHALNLAVWIVRSTRTETHPRYRAPSIPIKGSGVD